jgi:hypothetical protein
VMTVEVENAVGEQYMMVQMKALCKQTIEQECLIDSIEHVVACERLHLPSSASSLTSAES